jgi:membrane protein required for colicin V production
MNYLDVFLALPLLWGAFRGFTKGFVVSVATLVALILGIYAAIHFSSFFEEYFIKWFHPDPKYLKILSFALTFILVILIVRLIGWSLDKLIKTIALGFVNRLLGVLFNVLKWAFILSVLISIFDGNDRTKDLINKKVKEESIFYRPLSRLAPYLFPYLDFDKLMEKINNSSSNQVVEKNI